MTLQEYAQRFGVKQYIAIVRNSAGTRFAVFRCGDDRYYLFTAMTSPEPGDTRMTTTSIPILRKRLRDDIRRALAKGIGNSPEPVYHFLPPGVTWNAVRRAESADRPAQTPELGESGDGPNKG